MNKKRAVIKLRRKEHRLLVLVMSLDYLSNALKTGDFVFGFVKTDQIADQGLVTSDTDKLEGLNLS